MNRRHLLVSVSAAFAAAPFGLFRSRALAMPTRTTVPAQPRATEPARSVEAQPASNTSFGSGLTLAGGFRVVQAYEAHYGALPFVLEGEGVRFQVDVLRAVEAGTIGVFATEHFNLFVHGQGGATQERGARALALALEERVASGVAAPALDSFDERASHADACLHVDFVPVHV